MESRMFTIIGGYGKEYGPVTVDQVRTWMAAGRANLTTKVKAVGTDEWKTIAEVPEITGSTATAGIAGTSVPSLPPRAASLDILSCYARSWELLKGDFWPIVGVSFLILICFGTLAGVEKHGLYFLGIIFNKVLAGGLYYYFVLKIRGRPATVGDAFAGFTKAFLPLVVIGLLFSLFVTLGVLCLILPGIYLAVAYVFASIVAVDKGLPFWDSMEMSRKVITRNWWPIFGLLLLAIPVFIVGALALGVGIFVAAPVVVGAIAYAYEDLCNPGK
jgi:uncharacterized membrane protein